MSLPFPTRTEHRRCCHGGRTVLTLTATLPTGSTAAEIHLRELALALLKHAEATYLPAAAAELENAAASGALYDFFAYRYAVNLQQSLQKGIPHLLLTASLLHGTEHTAHQSLLTLWTADLSLQLPLHATARARPAEKGRKIKSDNPPRALAKL